jgi:hypothetical protein
MKAYIITVEDVFDFNSSHRTPIVKFTKKEAQKEMRYLAREAKADFKHMNNVICSGTSTSIEIYPEGYFGENHFSAFIDQVDIPGVVKARN